jgi:DNA adenine methylase
MKPFLKWAGGKYRIVDRVKAALPDGNRLIEPFAGSAAVFLNTDFQENIIADTNSDLIGLYKCLQAEGSHFVDLCKHLFIAENNNQEAFYRLRDEFNNTDNARRKAALFVYLNRHCFNGLCRYNRSGRFNVPFGRYTKPYLPETEMMNFWRKSQSATFIVSDFVNTMESATQGDVVYCDPPYEPLTATASFTQYAAGGFGRTEQHTLAFLAHKLRQRGVPVIISNHDTDFTRSVYDSAKIDAFSVQRFISSDSGNRGKADELLAVFA